FLDDQEATVGFRDSRDCDLGGSGHFLEYNGRNPIGFPTSSTLSAFHWRGDVREQHRQLRFATRSPCSGALAFQMESNSCRYSFATGGLFISATPSQVSARMRYTIPRSSAIR